jgi:hypothetical protein
MQRRFVFVSADVIRPGMRRFLDDTQSAAFLKPFDLGAFRRTVQRILRPDPAVDCEE